MKNKFEKEEPHAFMHRLITLALFVAFLLLASAFLILLKQQTGSEFGFAGGFLAFASALIITFFLRWSRHMMQINEYLGLIFGVAIVGALIFALLQKFTGPFTTTFSIIGLVLSLIYLIFYFLHYRMSS